MIFYRLDRIVENEKGVAGMLYRNDELLCATLEPPLTRTRGPAIPAGTYPLHWAISPRLSREQGRTVWTPRLKDVPGRSGILIHGGNTIQDTTGCILVGEKWAEGKTFWLARSVVAKKRVYEHVKQDTWQGGFAVIQIVPRDAGGVPSLTSNPDSVQISTTG